MYQALLTFPHAVFGDVFGDLHRLRRGLDDASSPSGDRSAARGAYPALNIGRTPTAVEVYVFAPGLDASKIDVTLDRGVLTLSGEREATLPEGAEKARVHSRERAGGRFTRAVSLPEDIDPARVEASYRDGVLRVSIARKEAAQPKRIAVQ